MDTVVALAFVFCASVAVFIGVHKEEIQKGEMDQVLASYVEG